MALAIYLYLMGVPTWNEAICALSIGWLCMLPITGWEAELWKD